MWRKWLFTIQEMAGLTEKECRTFLIVALLLCLGALARYFPKSGLLIEDGYYAEIDEEFRRLSARADSIDRAWRVSPPGATLNAGKKDGVGRIDLNLATSQQLQTLPRIGPKTAERILALRVRLGRFLDVSDLLMVEGIGQITLENLQDFLFVSDESTESKSSTAERWDSSSTDR